MSREGSAARDLRPDHDQERPKSSFDLRAEAQKDARPPKAADSKRLKGLEKSYAELKRTHADFEKEGKSSLADSLQDEIDELEVEITRAGGSVEAKDEEETMETARAARSRELRDANARDIERQSKASEQQHPAGPETKAAVEGISEAALEQGIIDETHRRLAELRRALGAIGEDQRFAATKRALEKEFDDALKQQGFAALKLMKLEKLGKASLREATNADIDAAINAPMKVDKAEEYRRIIADLAAEEATERNAEYQRFIKDEQVTEALKDLSTDDINKQLAASEFKGERKSVADERHMTQEQALAEAKKLEGTVHDLEFGGIGIGGMEKALKEEHGYDVRALKNMKKGLGATIRKWFKGLQDPHFPFMKKLYDERLGKLGAAKTEHKKLLLLGTDRKAYDAYMKKIAMQANEEVDRVGKAGPKERTQRGVH